MTTDHTAADAIAARAAANAALAADVADAAAIWAGQGRANAGLFGAE